MPSKARVDAFIETVVSGNHVEAIENFYHEDATMQENLATPRQGRVNLMNHEADALTRVKSIHTHRPSHVVVDGDTVVIHWIFDMEGLDGSVRRLEELSLQVWNGDQIQTEQFFYDTATAWREV